MTGFKIKFRKLTAALLSFAALLVFTGCDGEEAETTALTDEMGEPIETVAITDEEGNPMTDEEGNALYEIVEEEKIIYKVGFIYGGGAEDGATNAIFENARKQIEKTLGLDTCYIDNVLVADFAEAVATLKEDGCNIIISCNSKFANSTAKEAKVFDGTYYLSFGSTQTSATAAAFGGELYQTAAVCGITAAYNTVNNVIGIVADPGSYNVYGVIDAFVIGAAEIWGSYTDVRLNWVWTNDEASIAKAIDDLLDQGCDVIMSYTESDFAPRYCADKNVGVIANCHDLPEIAPDNYLTGYFFNFGTYIIDQVRAIENDNFSSRVYAGDIASGCARMLEFGPRCVEGTKEIAERYYEYIKTGQAQIFSGELRNTKGNVIVEKGQAMSFMNVLEINWLAQGIRRINSFTDVTQNPVGSSFEIKR